MLYYIISYYIVLYIILYPTLDIQLMRSCEPQCGPLSTSVSDHSKENGNLNREKPKYFQERQPNCIRQPHNHNKNHQHGILNSNADDTTNSHAHEDDK